MSELLSYLIFPLARLIYQSAPSKLRTALANGGRTLIALEVAIALYAISLRYLPAGEFLDKIYLPKPWDSISDPWDLLIVLSVLIIAHHVGGKIIMNLKFLLQPTIEKIREDLRPEIREEVRPEVREEVRPEVREEVTAEVREEVTAEVREEVAAEVREEVGEQNTRALESWWEEQIRAGNITLNRQVELPAFGGNGNGNIPPCDNGKEEE